MSDWRPVSIHSGERVSGGKALFRGKPILLWVAEILGQEDAARLEPQAPKKPKEVPAVILNLEPLRSPKEDLG